MIGIFHRHDHHNELWMALRQQPARFDPAHPRHPFVHDHKRRRQRRYRLESGFARRYFAHQLKSVSGVDDFLQHCAKRCLIFDRQNRNWIITRSLA
jgi:hypothetical protein